MTTKHKYNKYASFGKLCQKMIFLLALSSCITIDLVEKTTISLTTDWTNRSNEVTIPEQYTVVIGEQQLTMSGPTNALPTLDPGQYNVWIYNLASSVQIDGQYAHITPLAAGILTPNPGWFFTANTSIATVDFTSKTITVPMQQQVRELQIILKPSGDRNMDIVEIDAKLSGIAGTWDLAHNKVYGESMTVPLKFAKLTDGTWMSTVRLLGTMGNKQEIQGIVKLSNMNTTDLKLSSDMSAEMGNFNEKKHIPMVLSGSFETGKEAGFDISIKDWNRKDEQGVAW